MSNLDFRVKLNDFFLFNKEGYPFAIKDFRIEELINFIIKGDGNHKPVLNIKKINGNIIQIGTDADGNKFRREISFNKIDEILNKLFPFLSASKIKSIREKILLTLTDIDEKILFEKGIIRNDIISFKNGVILEFNKDGIYVVPEKKAKKIFSLNIIETDYNEKINNEKFNKFIKEIFSDIKGNFYQEKHDFLQEFFGYCLTKFSELQAMCVILGSGANGKGVILETFGDALGKKNVSGVKLSETASDRFALAEMNGKIVNIESDGGEMEIKESSFLKSITANDAIRISKKFVQGDGEKVSFDIKMLMASNHLPKLLDDSFDAWDRRLFGVILKNRFEVNPKFKEITKTKEFKQAMIKWALTGLERLVKNNWKLTKDIEFFAEVERQREQIFPVYAFCKENHFFTEANRTQEWANNLFAGKWEKFIADNNVNDRMKRATFSAKVIKYCDWFAKKKEFENKKAFESSKSALFG